MMSGTHEVGTISATHGPNSMAVPYTTAIIHKLDDGNLYVEDQWFGKVFLPKNVADGQVVETRPGCYGRVNFFKGR